MERKIINPWTWQDAWGYVQANEVSGFQRVIMIAGQTAADAEGNPMHAGDMRAQVSLVLDNLEAVLEEAGANLSNVMRLKYYTTDVDSFLEAADIWGSRLAKAGCKPATTLLGVTRLATPITLVEFEATAVV